MSEGDVNSLQDDISDDAGESSAQPDSSSASVNSRAVSLYEGIVFLRYFSSCILFSDQVFVLLFLVAFLIIVKYTE